MRFEKSMVHGIALACFVSTNASAHSGDPDVHFGTSGTIRLSVPDAILPVAEPLEIDQTNRVIFGASTVSGDIVGALTSDGSLDTTFASAGFIHLDQYLTDFKVDSKNRIVVLQSDVSGSFVAIKVSRFLSDGSIDTSFGTSGAAILALAGEDVVPSAIALDDADDAFVVGTEPSDPLTGDSRIVIGKVTSDGARDFHFVGNGLSSIAVMPAGSEQSYGQAITVDRAGGIVLTGYTRLATRVIVDDVIKLSPDGMFDPAFGAGKGFVQTDALGATTSPHYTFSESIAIDETGNIVTAGFAGDWSDYSSSFVVARYSPDGALDASFNGGAPELLNITGHRTGQAASALIDARGRIVLTGLSAADVTAPTIFAVFRLNNDGSRDTSFGYGDGSVLLTSHVAGDAVR